VLILSHICIENENKAFIYSFIAVVLGILLVIFSIYITDFVSLDKFTEQFKSASLFQRSGALLTILGLLSEYFLLGIPIYIIDKETNEVTAECGSQLRKRYKWLNVISFVEIIIGTIIWAYGDIIYIILIIK